MGSRRRSAATSSSPAGPAQFRRAAARRVAVPRRDRREDDRCSELCRATIVRTARADRAAAPAEDAAVTASFTERSRTRRNRLVDVDGESLNGRTCFKHAPAASDPRSRAEESAPFESLVSDHERLGLGRSDAPSRGVVFIRVWLSHRRPRRAATITAAGYIASWTECSTRFRGLFAQL